MAAQTTQNVNPRHFCILIVPEDLPADSKKLYAGRKAALLRDNKWQPAETITVSFMESDEGLRKRVQDVALSWIGKDLANLNLRFVTDGAADVRIRFQQGAGSWSYIGTMCREIPGDQPTMNFGWLTATSDDLTLKSVVLHEFGHALGLIHEHQSPNHPIQWNRPAVIRDLSGPPNNWDEQTIQRNIFDRYDPTKVDATPVDPKSIMMYAIPASWTLDDFSTGFNSELSASDRALIASEYSL